MLRTRLGARWRFIREQSRKRFYSRRLHRDNNTLARNPSHLSAPEKDETRSIQQEGNWCRNDQTFGEARAAATPGDENGWDHVDELGDAETEDKPKGDPAEGSKIAHQTYANGHYQTGTNNYQDDPEYESLNNLKTRMEFRRALWLVGHIFRCEDKSVSCIVGLGSLAQRH